MWTIKKVTYIPSDLLSSSPKIASLGSWVLDNVDSSQTFLPKWHPKGPDLLLLPRALGKNTGMGCHFLLQDIFQTQWLNWHLLFLWHWQADSLTLSHLGSPNFCVIICYLSRMPAPSCFLFFEKQLYHLLPLIISTSAIPSFIKPF